MTVAKLFTRQLCFKSKLHQFIGVLYFRCHFISSFSSISHPNGTFLQKAQTFMSLFKLCSSSRDLEQIHCATVKLGFDQDLFAMGKIIELCGMFGDVDYGVSVFDSIENPDGFVWNTMIRVLGKTNQPWNAIGLYKRMIEKVKFLDSFTFSFLFKVSGQLGSEILGKQIHGCALKHGLESNVFVRNNMIHMYGLLRQIDKAIQLFDEMPDKDLVTWNTMISCHVYCGKCEESLNLFSRMLRCGFKPDDATFAAILSACSSLGVLVLGRCIHSYINVVGFGNASLISNSLVHMYAQCGAIDDAYKTFNNTQQKTLVSWNTMILALATHGHKNKALALFSKMVDEELEKPDDITFLGVLSACSHGGMVDEGRRYFTIMSKDYRIEPSLKHYGCMVDILGRAGLVDEAYELIMNMPMKCNAVVWRALLAACKVHGYVELGEKAREHLSRLEPNHSGDYVLLANMYASSSKWNEVVSVRALMNDMQVLKPKPGISLIGNSFV